MKKSVPYESAEQNALVKNLRRKGFFVYAIPNHKGQRKDTGAIAGIPDLQVVLRDKKVIWIELKRTKGGVVSDDQKFVHEELENLGHTVILGIGAKDALAKLEAHLDCEDQFVSNKNDHDVTSVASGGE